MAVAGEGTLPSPWAELLAGNGVRRVVVDPARASWLVYLAGSTFAPGMLERLRESILNAVPALRDVELLVEGITPEVGSVLEELRRRAPLAAGLLAGASFYGDGEGWTVILPNQLVHTLWHRQGYDRLFARLAGEVRGRVRAGGGGTRAQVPGGQHGLPPGPVVNQLSPRPQPASLAQPFPLL
ncbi:MAG: hypothetical protein H5T97_04340, partial [Firmicutes bacterium]|nr:hypothetical protein [Bacillota bacterium]